MQGNLNAAQTRTEQARQRFPEQQTEWGWKFRLIEANLCVLQGRSGDALSLLVPELPEPLAANDAGIQRAMIQALAFARLGQMKQADSALQQAQSLSDKNHSTLAGDLFRTKGVVALEQNNLMAAKEMFGQTLQIARQTKDKFLEASALLNLGVVALQEEHFDEALDWSKAAASTAENIGARLLLERAQANVGWADYQLGNFEEALVRFRSAEEQAITLGVVIDRTRWLNNSGLCLYHLGHLQEAETSYQGAIKIAEDIRNQQEIIDANIAIASLLLQRGQIDTAARYTEQASLLALSSNRNFDQMNAQFLEGLIAFRQNKLSLAADTLATLEANPILRPSLRWQVEDALANIYTETNQFALADKLYRQSITTFETQRITIQREESKLPFSTNADQLYDDYVRFLVKQKSTDEALRWLDLGRARTLEEGLGRAAPDFKALTRKPLDTPGIAGRLHGTILIYSLAPEESYLWAVNSSGAHFFKLPRQEEIDAHVKNYQRAILASRDPLSDAYADGMALYRTLIEPAASLIPKGSPVYIIPDGSLSTLNFETLLAPGGGIHYWIEDATITNASSLRLLAAFHPEKRARNRKQLLLIGNPVSPDEKFPDLPNASAEVTNVAKHFAPADESIFVQKQALPSTYTDSNPGDYSLIHFVAHGTSSSASPLDSAIVLTRNPANPDSFKLYARDVIKHPLHADLVAISACYGSGSRVYGGEGLIGLSWAFLRAGSHYVIGSLWAVSDSAAPQIMDHMYGELASGRSPDAALRDAKLSMIKNSQNVFRKPLYWATFQLYGGA